MENLTNLELSELLRNESEDNFLNENGTTTYTFWLNDNLHHLTERNNMTMRTFFRHYSNSFSDWHNDLFRAERQGLLTTTFDDGAMLLTLL